MFRVMAIVTFVTTRVNVALLALALLALAPLALPPDVTASLAQSSGASGSATAGSRQAPVGHRQPTAATVKTTKSSSDPAMSASEAEDRELDRKIRSICRGC